MTSSPPAQKNILKINYIPKAESGSTLGKQLESTLSVLNRLNAKRIHHHMKPKHEDRPEQGPISDRFLLEVRPGAAYNALAAHLD